MLLRVRVANHRSIRDEVELSLTASSFRGSTPPSGDWKAVANRVTAIYGANGSGKSTVLDALDFMQSAVRSSATAWAESESFPHHAFGLNATGKKLASLYEIDFVDEEVRYTYGFESTSQGIESEWLYSYPTGRRRVLFEREGARYRFGRSLTGETQLYSKMTTATQLYLSVAAVAKNPLLRHLRHSITSHILYARFNSLDQAGRINWIKRQLSKNEDLLERTQRIVGFADLGVARLDVREEKMTPEREAEFRDQMKRTFESQSIDVSESAIDAAVRRAEQRLELVHSCADESCDGMPLSFDDESSGTVAWLSLIVPTLHAIQRGLILMIDELDSSLHPRLSATLVELFNDPDVNRTGAQLIFTSHDTALLGNNIHSTLEKDQVWFTEKDSEGATSLYSLDEFVVRSSDNVEKRYLEGRYGALPILDVENLRQLLVGAQ